MTHVSEKIVTCLPRYSVVCDPLEDAVELFPTRREAERVVENWNRDEPERVGELHVELIEMETAPH